MQSKTIKTRKKLNHLQKKLSKTINKKTQQLLLNLSFKRNQIQKMIKPKLKTKMNNNRKKSKKVPKPLFKSNQNSKLSKINHNQMINKFRKIKKLKKQINRITMIKRNELKLEKGVKVKNKERKEVPIIVDRSQIVHKGSILSYRGQEEVKSRSKNQMKEMIIKEGSKHRIKQVTSQIKVGKDQKLTLIDLPRLLPNHHIKR